MVSKLDRYGNPIVPRIYVCDLLDSPLYSINGIRDNSCNLELKYNNVNTLTFTVDKYITGKDKRNMSSGYNDLDVFRKIHIENIGFFIINQSPVIDNDGYNESKTISAESDEIEFIYHDLVGFKINCGTTDSMEMLTTDNVDEIDGVEFAKEQIKFYNPQNKELSLLDIILNTLEIRGWEIGYIDEIPKKYKEYTDSGTFTEKSVLLKDEVGYFQIDSQNGYAFLTQDVERFFECIIEFDNRHHKINAYRVENAGIDTNIIISNRNLQYSQNISVDDDNIFTRFRVSGKDDLDIMFVNYGSNIIENISYFLTPAYMAADLIEKYKRWKKYYDDNRKTYADLSLEYNKQLDVSSELRDRVPLDGCSIEWFKLSDDDLSKQKDKFESTILGYESFYVDENGNFDLEALKVSPDCDDYYQIKDIILPNIKIEMDDRRIGENTEHVDYIKTYETDWKLYGLDELNIKLEGYKEDKKILELSGYDVAWDAGSNHSKDYHTKCYERYIQNCNQLDEALEDSCIFAYSLRNAEYENALSILESINVTRTKLITSIQKENWVDCNGDKFKMHELFLLSKLYNDTDYINENLFTSKDDSHIAIISEQWKLLEAGEDNLVAQSKPQYKYSANIDNLLAIPQFQPLLKYLELGNFIRLEIRPDFFVKLRLITMVYNPFLLENDLQIGFSDFIVSGADRNDLASILSLNSHNSKNAITGNTSSNSHIMDSNERLSSAMLQKIVTSTVFENKIKNIVTSMLMEVN